MLGLPVAGLHVSGGTRGTTRGGGEGGRAAALLGLVRHLML